MGKKKEWSEIDTFAEAVAKVSAKYKDGSIEQFYTIEGFKAGERWKMQSLKNKQLYDIKMVKRIAQKLHREAVLKFNGSISERQIDAHFDEMWEKQFPK